jgi:hypothetical protein
LNPALHIKRSRSVLHQASLGEPPSDRLQMKGYRNDPERTAEPIDADGWLHTGDLASIDDDGYVTITGRKKDVIINAAGKNMTPSNIENAVLAASPLIAQVAAVGDRRPYIVALVVLDPDEAASFAAQHGISDPSPSLLAGHQAVCDAVAAAVTTANSTLSRAEQPGHVGRPKGWQPRGGGQVLIQLTDLLTRPGRDGGRTTEDEDCHRICVLVSETGSHVQRRGRRASYVSSPSDARGRSPASYGGLWPEPGRPSTTTLTTTTTTIGSREHPPGTFHAGTSSVSRVNVRPEKRKAVGSTPPLTTQTPFTCGNADCGNGRCSVNRRARGDCKRGCAVSLAA